MFRAALLCFLCALMTGATLSVLRLRFDAVASVEPVSPVTEAASVGAEVVEPPPPVPAPNWDWIWEGGAQDSLVTRCVGSAEGTRTPNGAYNPAYWGHSDPGNRVWNIGSFSYQHGAPDPVAADEKQFARLQEQGQQMLARAAELGVTPTLHAYLNWLDLANQSPMAAIGGDGKWGSAGIVTQVAWAIHRGEAKNGDYSDDNIIWSRVRSYINPATGTWTATGLGANFWTGWWDSASRYEVWHDQHRRYIACANAIESFRVEGRIPEGF